MGKYIQVLNAGFSVDAVIGIKSQTEFEKVFPNLNAKVYFPRVKEALKGFKKPKVTKQRKPMDDVQQDGD
jgi:hypothetical protein